VIVKFVIHYFYYICAYIITFYVDLPLAKKFMSNKNPFVIIIIFIIYIYRVYTLLKLMYNNNNVLNDFLMILS